MIITDLNHFEVVSEETNVSGGFDLLGISFTSFNGLSFSQSGALATAIGSVANTVTLTNTSAVGGLFSQSQSQSQSVAIS